MNARKHSGQVELEVLETPRRVTDSTEAAELLATMDDRWLGFRPVTPTGRRVAEEFASTTIEYSARTLWDGTGDGLATESPANRAEVVAYAALCSSQQVGPQLALLTSQVFGPGWRELLNELLFRAAHLGAVYASQLDSSVLADPDRSFADLVREAGTLADLDVAVAS